MQQLIKRRSPSAATHREASSALTSPWLYLLCKSRVSSEQLLQQDPPCGRSAPGEVSRYSARCMDFVRPLLLACKPMRLALAGGSAPARPGPALTGNPAPLRAYGAIWKLSLNAPRPSVSYGLGQITDGQGAETRQGSPLWDEHGGTPQCRCTSVNTNGGFIPSGPRAAPPPTRLRAGHRTAHAPPRHPDSPVTCRGNQPAAASRWRRA